MRFATTGAGFGGSGGGIGFGGSRGGGCSGGVCGGVVAIDCVVSVVFDLPAEERVGRPDDVATAPRLGNSGVLTGVFVVLAFRLSAFLKYSVKTVCWVRICLVVEAAVSISLDLKRTGILVEEERSK